MARTLSKRQKAALDAYQDRTGRNDPDADPAFMKQLENLHDYETLYQDAARYLWDRETIERSAKHD